ncbi:MAG: hypothetical protein ABEI27_09440 [Halobellus sp.]|uniref:DUF7547 family protein n=1 Tax=Halobellus sp. TaxID=1979212 RepID=UPI0035D4BD17
MAPPDPNDRSDEELRDLVEDLDRTLSTLRDELDRRDDTESAAWRTGSGDRRGLQPPSPSDLFRFTEQHTIPTVISTLEATIRSLEMLRGVLRLVDPERSALDSRNTRRRTSSADRLSDGVAGIGRGAASGVERALSELQRALSESDLPDDDPSRELLEDARQLSEEVSDRLSASTDREYVDVDRTASGRERRDAGGAERTDAEGGGDADRRSARTTEPVEIDVTGSQTDAEGGADADASHEDGEHQSDEEDASPEVDVEAELESIKDEVGGDNGRVEPTADRVEETDSGTGAADSNNENADSEIGDADGETENADSHTQAADGPSDGSDTVDST